MVIRYTLDVYEHQILTYKDGPRAENVNQHYSSIGYYLPGCAVHSKLKGVHMYILVTQLIREVGPMLTSCWAMVLDDGPMTNQQ